MKRFSLKFNRRSLQRYGTAGVAGMLVLGAGLAFKPALRSNADIPQVLAGDNREQIQANVEFRAQQRQEQQRQILPENFDLNRYPVTNQNEKYWRNLLWTTAVVQPQDEFVASTIEQVLAMAIRPGLSDSQKRTIDAAVRVGTQLYLSNPNRYTSIGEQFRQLIDRSPDPEWVAIALSGLAKGGLEPEQIQPLVGRVKARFPRWSANVSLQTTLREMAELISPSPVPPLKDLLNWTIAPNQLQMYVLCQQNRAVLCQTVLKDRKGEFVRQQNGQLWSVPLLLRSIHSLSWNFSRGETPQGIFRIEGKVPQPDDEFFRAYGQFALVNLFVPFEPGAKQFLPGKSGPFRGSLANYKRLLPPSWRNHWSIQESFWAGRAGRSLFRIHGSGESPDFFSGKDKYPDTYNWNPTIGCLSALELYNEQGQLIQADMPKILNALEGIGGKNFSGYLVVVDLPGNATKPIALDAIETALGSGRLSRNSSGKVSVRQVQARAVKSPSKTLAQQPQASSSKHASASIAVKPAIVPQPPDSADAPASEVLSPSPLTQPEINPSTRPLPIGY